MFSFNDILLALVLVVMVLYWYVKTHDVKKYLSHIPGPPPLPLLGNALDFINGTIDLLPMLYKYKKEYGDFYKVQIGPLVYIGVVADHDMLEFILNSNNLLDKSEQYKFLGNWLGSGLLTSKTQKWRKHRKMLTPAFHFQILENFIQTFEAADKVLIEKLKSEVGNDNLDIYPLITLCALDIICESAMGVSVNAQINKESDFVLSTQELSRIIIERSISAIKQNNFLYMLTKDYYKEKRGLKVLNCYTTKVLNAKRESLRKSGKENGVAEDIDEIGVKKRKAFLDILLEARIDGKPLSDQDIRDEVNTFMFEGHDTTASGISFALYLLATHPEEQEKAYQEQLAIFENKDDPIDFQKLQDMVYLENIIKETLRLFPSVPVVGRSVKEDIDYNGILLPKGISLLLFLIGIHRDEKYFKDPNKFKPTRFEDVYNKKPYSYIPFSAGSRNCIGQKFAMYEMKAVISKILRNFELCPAIPEHEPVLLAETTLKTKNGIRMRLKLRK